MKPERGLIFDFHGTLAWPDNKFRWRKTLRQIWHSPDWKLAPNVVDFLEQAKSFRIPMTIATCGSFAEMIEAYQEFNLNRWFRFKNIVHADSGVCLKPDPEHYLTAAARIGLKPEQCVVFEDTLVGMESAWRAGVESIIGVNRSNDLLPGAMVPGLIKWINDFNEISLDEFDW
jgi:HAD superfamily hydrolase (TIGR01509 family)